MERTPLLFALLLLTATATAKPAQQANNHACTGTSTTHVPTIVGVACADATCTADADVLRVNYHRTAPRPAAPKNTTARTPRRSALLAKAGTRLEPR